MFLSLEKKNKEQKAIIDSNAKFVTYGEILAVSEQLADIFDCRMIVVVLNDNTVASATAYLSCMINNVVPIMLGASMDEELRDELLRNYEPSYIWMPSCMVTGEKTVFSYESFSLVATGNKPYAIYNELSLLLTTSGSTGSPKLVRHTYCNLESQGKNISAFFGLSEKDRPMIDLPINYTFGLSVLNSHLYVGATCLITNLTVISSEYWNFFKVNRATSITGVPYTFELLKKIRFFRMDLPSLELISQGGGKLSDELFAEVAEYANRTNRRFIATYGQTEGSARMTYLPAEDAIRKLGSIGKPIPEGKIYIMDEEGNEIQKADATGEMVYRGPNVTLGYAQNKDDLIKGDERKGVLYTGDIVHRDAEGYLFIVGRKKRFLKLNGYRVSLDECERLIAGEFETECACVGDDHKMRIVLVTELDEKRIRTFVSQKTGINSSFFEVNYIDKMPRNQAGKILYNEL